MRNAFVFSDVLPRLKMPPQIRIGHVTRGHAKKTEEQNSRESVFGAEEAFHSGFIIAEDCHTGLQLRATVARKRHPIRTGDLAEIAAALCAFFRCRHAVVESAVLSRCPRGHQTGIPGFHDFLYCRQDPAAGTRTSALRQKGTIRSPGKLYWPYSHPP